MRFLGFALWLLILPSLGFAQGVPDERGCDFCIAEVDSTCSAAPGPGDGTVRRFEVPCDGTYSLRAKTACTGGVPCGNCHATVTLAESGGAVVASCRTTDCDNGDCDKACAGIELRAGITYQLTIGLVPCPGNNCGRCPDHSCRAIGWVYNLAEHTCPDL